MYWIAFRFQFQKHWLLHLHATTSWIIHIPSNILYMYCNRQRTRCLCYIVTSIILLSDHVPSSFPMVFGQLLLTTKYFVMEMSGRWSILCTQMFSLIPLDLPKHARSTRDIYWQVEVVLVDGSRTSDLVHACKPQYMITYCKLCGAWIHGFDTAIQIIIESYRHT